MRPPPPERARESDPADNLRLISRLLALSWQYRGDCLLVISSQVALLGLGVTGLGLTGLAIDVIRHALDSTAPAPRWPFGILPPSPWSPAALLVFLGIAVLGVALLRVGFSYGYAIAVGRLVHLKLVPDLRELVFKKLERLSFRFFEEHSSGSIINRVTGDVQALRSFVDGVVIQGAIIAASLTLYLTYMLHANVWLTCTCLALTPIIGVLTRRFARWARPAYRRQRELVDQMVLAMSEGVQGILVTKVFGREIAELERFQTRTHAVLEQQREIFARVSRFGPTVGFVTHLNMGVLLVYGGFLVAHAELTLGQLIVFAGLLQQFTGQVTSMAGIVNTLEQSLTGARRVFEVLDAKLEIESPQDARHLTQVQGRIRFEHVSFEYEPGKPALQNVDFEIAPGQRVGIVGPTGSGKSTLLGLIPRFRDATQGRILLDGVDVRSLDVDSLRRSVGVVFQENLLFRATVNENIAFGRPDAPSSSIENAARIAAAEEFVLELPDGYASPINEGGVNLSGGQRQRLALARALLPEPSVLLLDDPTTAVDAETEHKVLQALERAMGGRTTLIVTHRLATLRRLDWILVLEAGRVSERGTHEELMRQRAFYWRMASLQVPEEEQPSVDPRGNQVP